ncbi:DUF4232 domain-containing protein [Mangrovihabitans endophyticus]|uniref:DUF4232 domain-containing protein n=1 Tax=Mangrovihabitans endophyticus TaxID=1751298 RepID=A0A8J3FQM5_9ACTN|nr:DUF4232 domain-containing protein [Mangrovihabitans endophyticus]GGL04475.1 hypothetical protein GCM10012284_43850 [Mangrovihabitans endophyticus]
MSKAKTMALVSGGLLAGTALMGCSSSATPTPVSAPSSLAAGTPVTSPAVSPTATSTSTGGGEDGDGGGGTAMCTVDDLSGGTKSDEGGGAAGHTGKFLIVTNMSDSACGLKGFPTVAFSADAEGKQVGSTFKHMDSDTPEKIVIQPKKDAYVTVLLADTGAEGDDCQPTQVQGYSLRLPGSDDKLIVQGMQKACAAQGKGVGQVGPFIQGTPE